MRLEFDKSVYNKGYAYITNIILKVLFVLFLFGFSVILIPIPTSISNMILGLPLFFRLGFGFTCMFGILVYPVALCFKVGLRRGIEEGHILIEGSKLTYSKLKTREAVYTGVNIVYNKYEIDNSTLIRIDRTRFYYKIYGNITKTTNSNGVERKEQVPMFKIPVAYESMNLI